MFYDAGSEQSWGRYLEAAPAGWSGSEKDPGLVWCWRDQPGHDRALDTGEDVGSGPWNTWLIVEQCGSNTAAGAADGYRGGGKADWFLPSRDELNVLYQQRAVVGALADDDYWSSSQDSDITNYAWYHSFGLGNQYAGLKLVGSRLVRPVRKF